MTKVLNWEVDKPIEEFAAIFDQDSFMMQQKALVAEGWQLQQFATL